MTEQSVCLGDIAWIEASVVDPTHENLKHLPHVSAEHIVPLTGELMGVRSAAEDGMESGKYRFDAGDVLYSKLRPYLRKAAIPQFVGLCSADMYPLKTDRSRILPSYLRLMLVSDDFNLHASEASARSRMPKLNREQLFAYEFYLPTMERQRTISRAFASQLAALDAARQAVRAQAQDVALLRGRVLARCFEGLDAEPATLGEVVLSIQAGKSFQTSELPARPDELGVLKVSAVSWSEFRADEAKALSSAYQPEDQHRVCQGDFLISRANTKELVGAVVLVDRHHPLRLLSDKTLRLVVDEELACKEYLLYALRAPAARRHIEHFATGTSDSMRNISQDAIASTPIALPPLSQQRLIAAKLKAELIEIDSMQRALDAQQLDLRMLPAKLLAQAIEN